MVYEINILRRVNSFKNKYINNKAINEEGKSVCSVQHIGNLFMSLRSSRSEVAQSCLTLCNPMDCSLPGFSIHGIFQARVLEWVAIFF